MIDAPKKDNHKVFIVATPADRTAELRLVAAEHRLATVKMIDASRFAPTIAPDYLLYMSEEQGLDVHHAAILPPFFPYVFKTNTSASPRIAFLERLVADLMAAGLYEPTAFRPPSETLRLWNDCPPIPIPGYADVPREWTHPVASEPIDLVITIDGESQIRAVVARISRLLLTGCRPADIKIVNATPADVHKLTIIADMYGFVINDTTSERLERFPLAARFLAESALASPRSTLAAWLADSTIAVLENQPVIAAIADIVFRYGDALQQHREILIHEFSATPVLREGFTNVVECIGTEGVSPIADAHYLIMNYEDGSLPPVHIDDDYLTDDEKALIGMETSISMNVRIRATLGRKLASLARVVLFRPLMAEGRETRPADILDPWRVVRETVFADDASILMSRSFAELRHAKMHHHALRFGEYPAAFPALAAVLASDVMLYDPAFGSLSVRTIAALRKRPVVLSATSLEAFHKCRFRFLCDHVLRLAPYESTLPQELGNLAHKALSDAFRNNGSAEASAQAEAKRLAGIDPRTGALGGLLAKRLAIVESRLRERYHPDVVDFSHETEYSYEDELHPGFIVKGTIDRVLILPKNDQNWTFVIDYKTGNPSFSMPEFAKGTDIQPVFYLHLLARTKSVPAFFPAGFYYQPVTIGRLVRSTKKDMLGEALKQDGRTLADASAVAAVGGPNALRNVRFKTDGSFYTDSAILTETEFQAMLANIDRLIAEAITAVMSGTYRIDPETRKPGGESASCEYCQNRGLCYSLDRIPEMEDIAAETEAD